MSTFCYGCGGSYTVIVSQPHRKCPYNVVVVGLCGQGIERAILATGRASPAGR
jgi:hypothetical protein